MRALVPAVQAQLSGLGRDDGRTRLVHGAHHYHAAFRNAAVTIAGVELIADEVRFLDLWFAQNPEVASTWPGDVIARRIREFMADGIITTEELGHLQVTLSGLAGNAFVGTGMPDGLPTKLPVNDEVHVAVPTCSFCFTGTFVFGMRGKCERAVIDLGGEATGNVT